MNTFKYFSVSVIAGFILNVISTSALAADDPGTKHAFPDTWMVRVGVYVIDGSNTEVSLNSDLLGLGTTIDYQRDLGGEDGDTIPRIDAYYRFNEKHRIDFTAFSIDRHGEQTLAIELVIEDETFNINETVSAQLVDATHCIRLAMAIPSIIPPRLN